MRGFMRRNRTRFLPLLLIAAFLATPMTALADDVVRGQILKPVEQPLILTLPYQTQGTLELYQPPKLHKVEAPNLNEVKIENPTDYSRTVIFSSEVPGVFKANLQENGEPAVPSDGVLWSSTLKCMEQPVLKTSSDQAPGVLIEVDQLPKFHEVEVPKLREVETTVALPTFSHVTVSPAVSVPKMYYADALMYEYHESEATKKLIENLPYPKTAPPEELTLEQLEAISKLPPKSNKAGMRVHPAMVPLFRNVAILYNKGKYKDELIHFRLHTPEKIEKGKKYPMIVWLHGAGECGSDNINQLGHLHHILPWLVGPKKRDFFMLVPQCPKNHSSWETYKICETEVLPDGSVKCHEAKDQAAIDNAPISFTLAMVKEVTKAFPVDKNRITVAGLSTGGEGTWKMLERAPNLFAAAVPIVSWAAMNNRSLRKDPILKKIPIWAIYSSDDRAIDYARKEFRRMQDRGCQVAKTEFGVCGHRAWTPAMLQGDIIGWLLSRAKDGERFYAAEPSTTGPEKIGIFADVTVGDLVGRKPRLAPKKDTKITKIKKGDVVWSMGDFVAPKKPSKKSAKESSNKPKDANPVIIGWGGPSSGGSYTVTVASPSPQISNSSDDDIDRLRLDLVVRYIRANDLGKAKKVADKIRNKQKLIQTLLFLYDHETKVTDLLDYIDEAIDRMEKSKKPTGPAGWYTYSSSGASYAPAAPKETRDKKPQAIFSYAPRPWVPQPVPAGKKNPKDECGKEWAMSTDTFYGMFPNGWQKEANYIPDYLLNETGSELAVRLAKAFDTNDLAAVRELCNSFIKLDDIPLGSPWFDTSGGRLKGRIKYTLNAKAKPVVEFLHLMAQVKAKSKKEYVELAKKALARINKITQPEHGDSPPMQPFRIHIPTHN